MLSHITKPASVLCATLALLSSPAWSLNILVGNDDSCTSEGINALADALESAGHTVTVYAPAGEQSGKSSSISTEVFQDYDISNTGFEGPTPKESRYCVRVPTPDPEEGSEDLLVASATPRDSVRVGLAAMGDNKPDLVISGTNDGANIGYSAIASGTIGGAIAAAQDDIPAIAVSRARGRFIVEGGMSFEEVGEFVVSVVAELESTQVEGQPLLPALTVLNINIPRAAPRAVAHTVMGQLTPVLFGPEATEEGGVTIGFQGVLQLADLVGEEAAEELANNPDATVEDFADAGLDVNDEASMHVADYITVTTIDADLTAALRQRELTAVKLRNLN